MDYIIDRKTLWFLIIMTSMVSGVLGFTFGAMWVIYSI